LLFDRDGGDVERLGGRRRLGQLFSLFRWIAWDRLRRFLGLKYSHFCTCEQPRTCRFTPQSRCPEVATSAVRTGPPRNLRRASSIWSLRRVLPPSVSPRRRLPCQTKRWSVPKPRSISPYAISVPW